MNDVRLVVVEPVDNSDNKGVMVWQRSEVSRFFEAKGSSLILVIPLKLINSQYSGRPRRQTRNLPDWFLDF